MTTTTTPAERLERLVCKCHGCRPAMPATNSQDAGANALITDVLASSSGGRQKSDIEPARPRPGVKRTNFPGMVSHCRVCDAVITITEQMCKHSNYRCESCQKEVYHKSWYKHREARIKKIVEWQKTPKGKVARQRYQESARRRNPEKFNARQLLNCAVSRGEVKRGPCEKCGETKNQAHHDDYARPLEVRWLCGPCHRALHGQVGPRKVA